MVFSLYKECYVLTASEILRSDIVGFDLCGFHSDSTVKIGYNDLGYNNKSPITTKFLCQQQNCVHLCTKTIGYNDIANNDKSQITTEFRCPVP